MVFDLVAGNWTMGVGTIGLYNCFYAIWYFTIGDDFHVFGVGVYVSRVFGYDSRAIGLSTWNFFGVGYYDLWGDGLFWVCVYVGRAIIDLYVRVMGGTYVFCYLYGLIARNVVYGIIGLFSLVVNVGCPVVQRVATGIYGFIFVAIIYNFAR